MLILPTITKLLLCGENDTPTHTFPNFFFGRELFHAHLEPTRRDNERPTQITKGVATLKHKGSVVSTYRLKGFRDLFRTANSVQHTSRFSQFQTTSWGKYLPPRLHRREMFIIPNFIFLVTHDFIFPFVLNNVHLLLTGIFRTPRTGCRNSCVY